jgi:hypothetical protein
VFTVPRIGPSYYVALRSPLGAAAVRATFYYSVAIVRSRDSCARKGLILSSLARPDDLMWRARVGCQSTKKAGILPAYRPESRPVVAQKAQPSGGLVKILAGHAPGLSF